MKTFGILIIGIIGMLGIISCRGKQEKKNFVTEFEVSNIEKDSVVKIKVKKLLCGALTPATVDCSEYDIWFHNSDPMVKICTIENRDSINLFMNIINQLGRDILKHDFNQRLDVRTRLLIYHSNNNIDTLCMDDMTNGCLLLNGELYFRDERLVKLIRDL
jgi:hypothetical protein